jgi:hypothetical protein
MSVFVKNSKLDFGVGMAVLRGLNSILTSVSAAIAHSGDSNWMQGGKWSQSQK